MNNLPELETAALLAEREFSRLSAISSTAAENFERHKRDASPEEFNRLLATVEQSTIRVQDAEAKLQSARAALSVQQEAKERQRRQETVQATYARKLTELETSEKTLMAQRKQLQELQQALLFGGQLRDRLLRELHELRLEAQAASQTA